MYAVPDVDEVVAVAKELGIHLSPDEAVTYRKYLTEQMKQLDTFVQDRLEEPKPPMVSAAPASLGTGRAQKKTRSMPGCGSATSMGRPKACLPARPSVTRTISPWQVYP